MIEQRITVDNPNGRIGVNNSDFSCLLQIDTKVVGGYWHDCAGSVGQCVWLENFKETGITTHDDIASWDSIISSGNIPEGMLDEIFKPVTDTLVSGVYDLILEDESFDFTWEMMQPCTNNQYANGFYEEIYPCDLKLISTLPEDRLDASRIHYFQQMIKNQQKPIAISLSNQNKYCSYILDGHHKLAAYQKEGVTPRILFIECVSTDLQIEGEAHITNRKVRQNYIRTKKIDDSERRPQSH